MPGVTLVALAIVLPPTCWHANNYVRGPAREPQGSRHRRMERRGVDCFHDDRNPRPQVRVRRSRIRQGTRCGLVNERHHVRRHCPEVTHCRRALRGGDWNPRPVTIRWGLGRACIRLGWRSQWFTPLTRRTCGYSPPHLIRRSDPARLSGRTRDRRLARHRVPCAMWRRWRAPTGSVDVPRSRAVFSDVGALAPDRRDGDSTASWRTSAEPAAARNGDTARARRIMTAIIADHTRRRLRGSRPPASCWHDGRDHSDRVPLRFCIRSTHDPRSR